MCQCFGPICSFADCWLLSERRARHDRQCARMYREKTKILLFDTTWHDADGATKPPRDTRLNVWRNIRAIMVWASHIRMFVLFEFAILRGHILYTHLSGPAWIARFSAKFCGRTLAITSAFHDTLQRRWVPWTPLHHASPDLTMTYEPLFHGSTCRFAGKTVREHQRRAWLASRLEQNLCRLFFPLTNAKLSIKIEERKWTRKLSIFDEFCEIFRFHPFGAFL